MTRYCSVHNVAIFPDEIGCGECANPADPMGIKNLEEADAEYGFCDVCATMLDAGEDGRGGCPADPRHDCYSDGNNGGGNLSWAEREALAFTDPPPRGSGDRSGEFEPIFGDVPREWFDPSLDAEVPEFPEFDFSCDTCDGSGRWMTTFEDAPTDLVDIGPCPECTKSPFDSVADALAAVDEFYESQPKLRGTALWAAELEVLRNLYNTI